MKFLPEPILKSLEAHFKESGQLLKIIDFSYASGGCINSAGILDSNIGKMFIKWNNSEKFPGMFEAESKGLQLLRAPNVIRVPEPLFTGDAGIFSYLVTEYVGSSSRATNYWDLLGQQLVALHQTRAEYFGLDHHNYIGSLVQKNNPDMDWITFFINQRLEIQIKIAIDSGKIDKNLTLKFQNLYSALPSLLNNEEPSCLIHGDLWAGNLMTGPFGEPVIFDPAVYYGHREMELAMTYLFGGFSSRFYEVYAEISPLEPDLDDRIQIYQLYPLLVHVNLFGGGYISQVRNVLNRFV